MIHSTRLTPSELLDLLDHAPMGVLVEDCTGRVLWLNQTLVWQLGIDAEGSAGAHVSSLPLEPLGGARGKRYFRTVPGRGAIERDLQCIEDILPEFNDTGIRVRYFLEVNRETREVPRFRHGLLSLLRACPTLDRPTGACDKRTIMGRLRSEVSRSRRYANPLSIMIVMVDAPARDGHVVDHPSRIMARAAGFLRDSTRWADVVGRFGASEFLLILPETSLPSATQLAKKIRASLDDAGGQHDGVPLRLSFGVAEWCRGDDEVVLCERAASARPGNEGVRSSTSLPDSR